jgi:hypothetical protein
MHHHMTQTPWIRLLAKPELGLWKQKISFQEEHDTNNMWVVAEKEDYPEDLSKRMDQGKSSHVFSVGNQVTSHEIANRNGTAIRAPHAAIRDQCAEIKQQRALGKPDKKKKKALYKG